MERQQSLKPFPRNSYIAYICDMFDSCTTCITAVAIPPVLLFSLALFTATRTRTSN